MERQAWKQGEKARRLVFVLSPFQGHINPMLQLAAILRSKGFSVTIIHPQFNSPIYPSNHPEFTFIPISDDLPEMKFISSGDLFGITSALNKNCAGPMTECLQEMFKAHQDSHDRIYCIIYDALMFFSQSVADHFKLPGICVRTSSAASTLAIAVFPRLHQQGYCSFLESMSQEDQRQELQSLLLKESSVSMRETDAVLEVRASVTDAVKKCSAIVVNTVNFLEQEALTKLQQLFSASTFTIGPFHKSVSTTSSSSLLKEDNNCISWLNRQAPNSVIYVSFGSIASLDEKELLETAWGLANCEQPFLWVVRPGLVCGSNCLELLPKTFQERVGERGCIVEWAPQKEVLANDVVGVFWSHCGWNSTLESICEGVPMLCRPFFGDQNLNMRYVCDVWNVGLELEELERGKIEKAIKRLMADTEGEEMRKRAVLLKEKVELSLKEGGTCYYSSNDLVEKILSF